MEQIKWQWNLRFVGEKFYLVGLSQRHVSEWRCFSGLEYMGVLRISNGVEGVLWRLYGGHVVCMSEMQVRRKFHYDT
jgi:hypothetical protein